MKRIFICLMVIVFTGCSNIDHNVFDKTDDCKDGCEIVPTVDDNTEEQDISIEDINLEVITLDKALEYALDNKTNGLFMLSFADCPWCMVALPLVEEMAKQHPDISTYYVDITKDETTDGEPTYDRYYELVKPFLDEQGYEKIYAPSFVFIRSGSIVKYHTGMVGKSKELTEEEKNIFRAIINSGYELIEVNE